MNETTDSTLMNTTIRTAIIKTENYTFNAAAALHTACHMRIKLYACVGASIQCLSMKNNVARTQRRFVSKRD